MILYTKAYGDTHNAAIGKLETPIKMIIEHESDLITKKGGICDWLFNVEKSNRFGETIVGQNEFEIFAATVEGGAAESDNMHETYRKFIEHIQFMKEFVVTAEMMEDANYGIAADAKRRAENFTRAYYKTINKLCETALINGTNYSTSFAGTSIDLTTGDGIPLFNAFHKWGSEQGLHGTQSNYFYGDIFASTIDNVRVYSTEVFEKALARISIAMRNMKDENGEPLGYTADTIILPGNRYRAETIAKKVCGSEGSCGNGYNDINLNFGNWNVIILPHWQPSNDCLMVMSSEANKNLSGNMFFNRVPLTVSSWIDHHTGNYVWNGRCRFGVGFGTYKHIILATDSPGQLVGSTKIP